MFADRAPLAALDVASLSWQPSLFAAARSQRPACRRVDLGDGCWVDHAAGWLADASDVMAALVEQCPWRQRKVVMFDKLLDEPRLTAWWSVEHGQPEPLPVLAEVRHTLSRLYRRTFDSIGLNLYRDGADSVAWHRDRVRRRDDAIIAIVSVGEPRPFQMRPRGGRLAHTWRLGDGDLLVMGGRCQEVWEHAVPKSAHVQGPRMSITFRHGPIDELAARRLAGAILTR